MKFCRSLVPLILLMLPCSLVYAQFDDTRQRATTWYLEERFIIADQNDDALLDRSELQRFNAEFAYYLDSRNYQITDKNQDGMLSFNEMLSMIKPETAYRYSMERRQLAQLMRMYPGIENPNLELLRNTPELVNALFGNLVWMYEHADLAQQLYADPVWTQRYPESLVALHQNLRWMVANPTAAKNVYRNRVATQRLPELLGWRADHKDFIRNNSVTDRFYDLDFIPEEIRNR